MHVTVITGMISMAIQLTSAEENYRATVLLPHSLKSVSPCSVSQRN